MTQRRALWHKVAYASAIVVLLLPLSYLSQPQTKESEGGKLAQLREKYRLSQADLGEIDPTSEAIKLAMLGLRGVAADVMWQKAIKFQREENWTAFSAALEQIIRLQPNFVTVWRFQAHNISYNTSVQFDDYHDRYHWVMKGINFLINGSRYNANQPQFLYEVGWFISQKIGRADEKKLYRKLFKEDDEFHKQRKPAERDNWLVGREWFLKAQNVVDQLGVPVRGQSPLVFHSYPSMALFNYSEAIEEDGTYGEVALNSWRKAHDSWKEFGDRDIATSDNLNIHLNDRERGQQRAKEATEDLSKLLPGVREKLREQKLAALDPAEREVWETAAEKRTPEQAAKIPEIEPKVFVSVDEVAALAPVEHKLEALRLVETINQNMQMAQIIDRYRSIVNFDYWRLRAETEQDRDALDARRLVFEGDKDVADLELAKKKYDEAFSKWRKVLDRYPTMLEQFTMIDEFNETIDNYKKILDRLDQKLPEDFILKDVLARDQRAGVPNAPPAQSTPKKEMEKESATETKQDAKEKEAPPATPGPSGQSSKK